jgi:hypothetical protein
MDVNASWVHGPNLAFVAMIFASVLAHAPTVQGTTSWLASAVVIWLVTTIGAILLFDIPLRVSPMAEKVIDASHTWNPRPASERL